MNVLPVDIYVPKRELKQIYLAGSGYKNPENSIKWREAAATMLPGFRTVSPFRGKNLTANNEWDKNMLEANEVVTRDLKDIRESDIVLAEMVHENYDYIGTSMEIMFASDQGIPVVVWASPQRQEHYWLKFTTVKMLPTLEECCAYINAYWR